jgi:hypothetical protein
MKEYFGIIQVGKISNERVLPAGAMEGAVDFIPMEEKHIRVVHYPDCQQLIIWLTQPGDEYGKVRLTETGNKTIREEWPVAERLNGSIQILWYTLPIAPGSYTIEIDHKSGWRHCIAIEKFAEGIIPPTEQKDIPPEEPVSDEPIIYRDGAGNILPNEDLILREKVNRDLFRKYSRKLTYTGTFRAGTIIYLDGDIKIEFPHEMGGGNCMFYVDIPTEEQWEAQTKTALSARLEILEFVAARVRAEQASNCRYEINGDSIVYYYN